MKMLENTDCSVLCEMTLEEKAYNMFEWTIERDYKFTWYVDNLPSALIPQISFQTPKKYESGIPLGYFDPATREYFLYNHYNIMIQYHETSGEKPSFGIVGFYVEPVS